MFISYFNEVANTNTYIISKNKLCDVSEKLVQCRYYSKGHYFGITL